MKIRTITIIILLSTTALFIQEAQAAQNTVVINATGFNTYESTNKEQPWNNAYNAVGSYYTSGILSVQSNGWYDSEYTIDYYNIHRSWASISLASIPAGANITSASFNFTVTSVPGLPINLRYFRMTSAGFSTSHFGTAITSDSYISSTGVKTASVTDLSYLQSNINSSILVGLRSNNDYLNADPGETTNGAIGNVLTLTVNYTTASTEVIKGVAVNSPEADQIIIAIIFAAAGLLLIIKED